MTIVCCAEALATQEQFAEDITVAFEKIKKVGSLTYACVKQMKPI